MGIANGVIGLFVEGVKVVGEQEAQITVPAAISGGESPTEAEFNALRQAVADIVAVLEAHGLTADA
jgi:hypothetical protein